MLPPRVAAPGLVGAWRLVETAVRAPAAAWDARPAPPGGLLVFSPRHDSYFYVRDSAPTDPTAEQLFFLKSARGSRESYPMEINGEVNPDTIVLQVGRRYRFRFIGLSVTSPNATVYLTARPDSSLLNLRDTMLVKWRPLAKDGADPPPRGPHTPAGAAGRQHRGDARHRVPATRARRAAARGAPAVGGAALRACSGAGQ